MAVINSWGDIPPIKNVFVSFRPINPGEIDNQLRNTFNLQQHVFVQKNEVEPKFSSHSVAKMYSRIKSTGDLYFSGNQKEREDSIRSYYYETFTKTTSDFVRNKREVLGSGLYSFVFDNDKAGSSSVIKSMKKTDNAYLQFLSIIFKDDGLIERANRFMKVGRGYVILPNHGKNIHPSFPQINSVKVWGNRYAINMEKLLPLSTIETENLDFLYHKISLWFYWLKNFENITEGYDGHPVFLCHSCYDNHHTFEKWNKKAAAEYRKMGIEPNDFGNEPWKRNSEKLLQALKIVEDDLSKRFNLANFKSALRIFFKRLKIKSIRHLTVDLHGANIMYRPSTKDLVLTDPLC